MKKKPSPPIDPIVEEVRKIKDRLAAAFNYDVRAILKDAQRRQEAGKRNSVPRQLSRQPG